MSSRVTQTETERSDQLDLTMSHTQMQQAGNISDVKVGNNSQNSFLRDLVH